MEAIRFDAIWRESKLWEEDFETRDVWLSAAKRAVHSRLAWVVAGALVLAGGASGAAVWSTSGIPDSNGVIHGCYSRSDGTVRVIDVPSQHC